MKEICAVNCLLFPNKEAFTFSLNPIWTLENGSLFLIRTTAVDFFLRSQQIVFSIEDYDGVSSNDLLGTVEVEKQQLLKGTGERVEFEIETNKRYDKISHEQQGMIIKPKNLKVSRGCHVEPENSISKYRT